MPEENLSELAKQGNPNAIAVMLNRSLQAKNIAAKVNRQEDTLHILLESAKVPQQKAMVSFIQKGLTKLGITSITTVKVYCRQMGEKSPAWSQTFEIVFQVETPEQIDIIETPSPPTDNAVTRQFEPEDETPSNTEQRDIEDSLSGAIFYKATRRVYPEQNTPLNTRVTGEQNQQRTTERASNSRDRQPLKPLSIGNAVSAGLRLYRDRFKLYFGLAFQAFLWSFIPIYGWAKSCQIQAIIARQSFSELVSQPESVNAIRTRLNSKLWGFWIAQILISLINFGINIGLQFASSIVNIPIQILLGIFSKSTALIIIAGLVQMVIAIGFIAILLWFYAHFFIAELPLALEDEMTSTDCISRSWKLANGFVWRIQSIILVATLITIPFTAIAALPLMMIIPLFTKFINPAIQPSAELLVSAIITVMLIISLVLILLSFLNTLIMPFWQAVKAVIYYDLRTRKEGLGLQLVSDREITENSK